MSFGRRLWNVARAEVRDAFKRKPREAPPSDKPSEPPPQGEAPPPPRARVKGVASDVELRRWYANLELPHGAPAAEVRAAYRRMMRRYHPDKHHGDPAAEKTATELAQALRRAYEGLLRHLGDD